jgi:hypothetical protein
MARGKTQADPAELERLEWPHAWPPPWRNDRLVGHELAERTMLAAQQSSRLHHAWLLTGPRGIGKATLAWRFARFLLVGQEGGLFGDAPDGLGVAREAPVGPGQCTYASTYFICIRTLIRTSHRSGSWSTTCGPGHSCMTPAMGNGALPSSTQQAG